jgi:NTP pyrophosphatase (non-canonical NTP hydrolase)
MDLKKIQQKTIEINQLFPSDYDKRDLMIDLVEEVGELANAILIVDKRKFTNNPTKKKTKADIANALGDILFDLLVMAQEYGLDMEEEMVKVLEEIKTRIASGEFEKR